MRSCGNKRVENPPDTVNPFFPGIYVVPVIFQAQVAGLVNDDTGTSGTFCGEGPGISDGINGSLQASATVPAEFYTGLYRASATGAD